MIKKVIAFQKLFFHSTPSINHLKKRGSMLSWLVIVWIGMFMLMRLFDGYLFSTFAGLAMWMAVLGVWTTNKNLNSDQRLFEMVPVSRQFTVANVYLASIQTTIIAYFAFKVMVGIIDAVLFSEELLSVGQITAQSNVFVLLLLLVIVFVGTTISFVDNNRRRNGAYIGFFLIGYGLLTLLKNNLPEVLVTGEELLMDSLLMMPEIRSMLIWLTIATLLIIPLSMYIGLLLYRPTINTHVH